METIVILASGEFFRINPTFSKPTFPPPTISVSNLLSFKKIG